MIGLVVLAALQIRHGVSLVNYDGSIAFGCTHSANVAKNHTPSRNAIPRTNLNRFKNEHPTTLFQLPGTSEHILLWRLLQIADAFTQADSKAFFLPVIVIPLVKAASVAFGTAIGGYAACKITRKC